MRCIPRSVFVLALFGAGEAAAAGGDVVLSGRSGFCSAESTDSYSHRVRTCGSGPAEANLAWPWVPSDLNGQEPFGTSGAVPCWHLDPSPWLSCEDLCLSLLVSCPLHSLGHGPEAQGWALERDRATAPALPAQQHRAALLAHGGYSLLPASGCVAPRCMWVSCCLDCSKHGRVSHGIQIKVLLPLHQGGVLGFCTPHYGLTLMRAKGVCSKTSDNSSPL